MARVKKLTRSEKVECTKKGECWKCHCILKQIGRVLKCENCGVTVPAKV